MKKKYNFVKRILDILFSLILLIVLFPIFIIISLFIKIMDGGNILFRQNRMGLYGKKIDIYKFRTMIPNAEELIKDFNKNQKKEFYENFKLNNDFRITRVGKILRKFNLDELPQLWNILKGDMSFIGPRPIVERELCKYYFKTKEKLLCVKPGLIGYWTCFNRNNIKYSQRVELELYYVDNYSLIFDCRCFIHSIMVMLWKK